MSVLKGKEAIERYGEKAKGGAILVITRITKEAGKPANTSGKTPFSYKQEANKSSYSYSTNNQDQSGVKLAYRKDKKKIGLFGKDSKVLVIIDGKESTKEMNDASPLDPNDIESMSILKDKSAIKRYGEKAKYGVVLITTKKNKDANDIKVVGYGATNDVKIVMRGASDKKNKPIIIIDGKESDVDISTLSPETIKSMTVLKGEAAIKKYGDKAKDGVVIVKLKEKKTK